MSFNNFGFLFLFFPVFFIAWRFAPRDRLRALMCAGSLVFYLIGVWNAPLQALLLVGMTALGAALCALFARREMRRRLYLALGVAALAAPLAYVKLAGLFAAEAPSLPLGLSFYTFELIAMTVYAYKGGRLEPLDVAAGTLAFPRVLSGPLVEPGALAETLRKPRRSKARLESGLEEFILGLALKVVIADHIGGLLGQIRTWGIEAVTVPMAWLGVIGYALQLYFDFWGYSRMAVGLGRMLGLDLPQNFDHPYCATSIASFWRRWHITLGQWFKTYVYIPLGGSRRGMARMVLSTLTVWLLTGIWHGAGWNYVCWGLMMFVLIMGERLLYGEYLDDSPVAGHIYVPLMIALSWVFFMTPTPAKAGAYFLRLLGAGGGHVGDAGDWKTALGWCWPYLTAGIVLCMPGPWRLWKKLSGTVVGWVVLFALFWVCAFFLATAASDPFMYYSF